MPALNYTTKIAATQTISECQAALSKHGVSAIATRYEDGRAVGLSFTLRTPHGERAFTMPVDVAAMRTLLQQQERDGAFKSTRQRQGTYSSQQHAERVAWRVVKDWLLANLALIEAQMASLDQVMLPYLHVAGELTLYEAYKEREQAAIEAGPS